MIDFTKNERRTIINSNFSKSVIVWALIIIYINIMARREINLWPNHRLLLKLWLLLRKTKQYYPIKCAIFLRSLSAVNPILQVTNQPSKELALAQTGVILTVILSWHRILRAPKTEPQSSSRNSFNPILSKIRTHPTHSMIVSDP